MVKMTIISRFIYLALLLILLTSLGVAGYLVFSNRQATRQFETAERLFFAGDNQSIAAAKDMYLACLKADENNEAILLRLAGIAKRSQNHPEVAYYKRQLLRLNPLRPDYEQGYLTALAHSRQFNQLETYLNNLSHLTQTQEELLVYAGYHNGNGRNYAHRLKKLLSHSQSGLPLLTQLIYESQHVTPTKRMDALLELTKSSQDIVAFESRLFLAQLQVNHKLLDQAEGNLRECSRNNFFATAPSLANFLATFRSFREAIPIYEAYLELYPDPQRAMRLGDIYALLKDESHLKSMLETYQRQTSKNAMMSCYYFEALLALIRGDMPALKTALPPLQHATHAPLLQYMTLCADIHDGNPGKVNESFRRFRQERPLMDFPILAYEQTTVFLRQKLAHSPITQQIVDLAEQLHDYRPQSLTAKVLLKDKLTRKSLTEDEIVTARDTYPQDSGIWKLAIEFYLSKQSPQADTLIQQFKAEFPQEAHDIVDYEIAAAFRQKNWDQVSQLLNTNLSPKRLKVLWNFAVAHKRINDLQALANCPLANDYRPFCQAEILFLQGKSNDAMRLFSQAPANKNLHLIFHAARRLGMNGKPMEALKRYAELPPHSRYELPALMNSAELLVEIGQLPQALTQAGKAWKAAPLNPATQLCYADKLTRLGNYDKVIQVIIITAHPTPFSEKLKGLWLKAVEQELQQAVQQRKWTYVKNLLHHLKLAFPKHPLYNRYAPSLPQTTPSSLP